MLTHPEIPWRLRARRYSNLIFNHLTWATLPLLLFFGGALPAFIDLDYSLSSTSALLGSLSASILTITLLNTLLLVQVDYRICPKPKRVAVVAQAVGGAAAVHVSGRRDWRSASSRRSRRRPG